MSLLQTGISRFVMMLVAVAWNVTVLAQGIPTATTSISPYDSSNHQDLPETIRAGATLADSESAGSSNSDMYTGMGVPLNQDGSAAASRFESAYTVLLTEPADNTEYLEPASITLTASAMNNEGAISKVEFYQGETLLCTVTETPYNFIWNNVSAGDYVLTAKAYDEMGASVISTPVHISVASAPAAAQLVIDSLAAWPTLVKQDQDVTVTAIVRNAGKITANNFIIDLYKDLVTYQNASQMGDVSCMVDTLAPGESTSCTGMVSYSKVGGYIVRAKVDAINAVGKIIVRNNGEGTVRVTVKLPDLVISNLSALPAKVVPGQLITYTATVKNTGEVGVGAFEVDIYQNLPDAPVLSQEGDISCNISGLAAKTSATCTGTLTATASRSGVWAQVDTKNAVDESDESNNVASLTARGLQ